MAQARHGYRGQVAKTDDPYKILVAVFMPQQTGASQVMTVYDGLVERFPTVQVLGSATDEQLAAALLPLVLRRAPSSCGEGAKK